MCIAPGCKSGAVAAIVLVSVFVASKCLFLHTEAIAVQTNFPASVASQTRGRGQSAWAWKLLAGGWWVGWWLASGWLVEVEE